MRALPFGVDVDAMVAEQDAAARMWWREQERVTRDWQRMGWGQKLLPERGGGSAIAGVARPPPGALAKVFPPAPDDGEGIKVVDIYLSAGPRESKLACTNENVGSCSIWRIRVELGGVGVMGIYPVIPNDDFTGECQSRVGFVQPAVSPSGTRFAFVGICHDNDGNKGTGILWTTDGSDYIPVESGQTGDLPQYPNWFSDDWLLFNKSEGSHPHEKSTLWWGHSWPDFSLVIPALGQRGFSHTDMGYEDAHTSANPVDGTSGSSMMVTFGGQITADPYERIPRVTSATGGGEDPFALPVDVGTTTEFSECHHPAWHPRGERILCTRQELPERVEHGQGLQAFRRLYASDWDGSQWPTPTPLVRLLSPTEFQATSTTIWGSTLDDVFPPTTADADGCWNYHWKFAEWCGHGRYVVAVLYCVDKALVTVHSRVMLIDLWADAYGWGGGADAYIDLVSYLEWDASDEFGSWDGAWVTCAPATDNG